MKIGFIGLGRMGMNMVKRLISDGHEIVAYARTEESVDRARERGATGAVSIPDLISKLEAPRTVWVMVPAGGPTQEVIDALMSMMDRDDLIIDGGNSYYKDSMERAEILGQRGIHFLDVGTSGGIWGLEEGYCMMVGGEREVFERVEPLFRSLAPDGGYEHVGPHGAGHFVKMVHNGIEYAMLQAYGEGFEILHAKREEFSLDLRKIARLWNHGSVIRSWLLDLAEIAFSRDPDLSSIRGYVEDSGEGRWTVETAIEESIPACNIALSLLQRFRSRQDDSFSAKVIAALRREFGGHPVRER